MTERIIAWFNPFSGIAGDMTLGSLLDAGADLNFVINILNNLNLDNWGLKTEIVDRNGLTATRAVVTTYEEHHHRRWKDIQKILQSADIPERVKIRSLAIFEALAKSEGAVHGIPADEVHFHEVGALDALVDIIGSCAALESLAVTEVHVGPIAIGIGTITAAHGVIPNPPPAVIHLLNKFLTIGVDLNVELTTPTGAAIVSALAMSSGPMPSMTITGSGYGAGTKNFPERSNTTQVIIGIASPDNGSSTNSSEILTELTTNIDDVTGEYLAHAMTKLREGGALDVWLTPIIMKKNRPANTLSILAKNSDAYGLAEILFQLTGTLGIRKSEVYRITQERQIIQVEIEGQTIDVKVSANRIKAEFEQVLLAAELLGLSPIDLARQAEQIAANQLA